MDIATAHPYFSPAHFFYLKQLQPGSPDFISQAAKTNILFNNAHWLSFQLAEIEEAESLARSYENNEAVEPDPDNNLLASLPTTEKAEVVDETGEANPPLLLSALDNDQGSVEVEPEIVVANKTVEKQIKIVTEPIIEWLSPIEPPPPIDEEKLFHDGMTNGMLPDQKKPAATITENDEGENYANKTENDEEIRSSANDENVSEKFPSAIITDSNHFETQVAADEALSFEADVETDEMVDDSNVAQEEKKNVTEERDEEEPEPTELQGEPLNFKLNLEPFSAKDQNLSFEPLHVTDYFASQGIKLSNVIVPGDKLGKQLKSFTEWLKTMKKVHSDKLPETGVIPDEQNIQQMAERSNAEGEVLTEAMAEVFVHQGKVTKAEELYKKLSLLNPAKSIYFAAKIEQLKEL